MINTPVTFCLVISLPCFHVYPFFYSCAWPSPKQQPAVPTTSSATRSKPPPASASSCWTERHSSSATTDKSSTPAAYVHYLHHVLHSDVLVIVTTLCRPPPRCATAWACAPTRCRARSASAPLGNGLPRLWTSFRVKVRTMLQTAADTRPHSWSEHDRRAQSMRMVDA